MSLVYLLSGYYFQVRITRSANLKIQHIRAIKIDSSYMYYCGTKVQSFNIRPAKQIYIAYMYIYTVKHMYNSFQIRKRRLDMHLQLLYKDH